MKLFAWVTRGLPWVFGLYLASLLTTLSGMEIFSWLFAVGTLALLVRDRFQGLDRPPFVPALVLFTVIVALGIWLGDASGAEKVHDFGRLRFFVLYPLLYWGVRRYLPGFPWERVLAAVALVVGIYGLFQHFVGVDWIRPEGKKIILYAIPETRTGPLVLGTFNHHLTFANVFLFYAALFFSLGLSLPKKRWPQLLLGTLLLVLVLWTQSRIAWFAVPLVVLIVAWGKSARFAGVCLLLVGLGLGTLYFTDAGFRQRFQRTFLTEDDFYNGGPRYRLWNANWAMFQRHPWIGMGWNNNERQAKRYVDRLYPKRRDNFYGHAHSTPLQILASTGIIGFGAYLALWGAVFLRSWRLVSRLGWGDRNRWIGLGALAAFAAFHLQGLTQWNFGDAEVLHSVVFFWVLVATTAPAKPT